MDPTIPLPLAWSGSLLDRFDAHARNTPDAPCAVSGQTRISYSQAKEVSDHYAQLIAARSRGRSGVISIIGDRSVRLSLALLSVIRSGFAFHIVDLKYPTTRILEYLNYIRPVGILTAAESPQTGLAEILTGYAPKVDFVLDIDADLERLKRAPKVDGPDLPPETVLAFDSPLYVAFTSGTTGLPKAVWGAHGPVNHFFEWQTQKFSIKPADKVSALSGLAHDPLLRDVLMPVWAGGSTWYPPEEVFHSPGMLYSWLRKERITVVHLTPSLCKLLLNLPKTEGATSLPDLRVAFFGGEPLSYQLASKFRLLAPKAVVVNCYGATETPQVMGYHVFDQTVVAPDGISNADPILLPLGTGIDGVQLLILSEKNELCAEGQLGEICVRTRYRASRIEEISGVPINAYAASPFSTDKDDLIYRTGDYGKYDKNLTVYFAGRKDRQIKVRGFRVDLSEIERAIQAIKEVSHHHLEVRDADAIALFIVPELGAELSPAAVRTILSRSLPPFMLPNKIVCIESLPMTPNGKIDREKLNRIEAQSFGSTAEPKSGEQGHITEKLRNLGFAGDRVYEFMDSLQLIELACKIENAFGVKISALELKNARQLEDVGILIARYLRPDRASDSSIGSPPGNGAPLQTEAKSTFQPKKSRILPPNERIGKAITNRVFQILARVAPDALRVKLHRWRGVSIGENVSIGYDSIIETAFPHYVRLGNHVNIGMRVTIIGHFRGMEHTARDGVTVSISDYAFVGPGVIILPNVHIGEGAVVAAGSVVSSNVEPYSFVQGNPARMIARCGVALSGRTSYSEFLHKLVPVAATDNGKRASDRGRSYQQT